MTKLRARVEAEFDRMREAYLAQPDTDTFPDDWSSAEEWNPSNPTSSAPLPHAHPSTGNPAPGTDK